MSAHALSDVAADATVRSAPWTVDVDALCGFPELVHELGGSADALLRQAGIDPIRLSSHGATIEYHAFLQVLQHAAEALACPEFGFRLAAAQGGNRAIGPIGVVMKNSKTVGQAIGYCAKHIQAYSLATRVRFDPDRSRHLLLVRFEILLDQMPDKRQAVEHALMLANLNIREIAGGAAHPRKILLSHEPQAPVRTYRTLFGCDVKFGQDVDGLVLTEADLLCPVADPDTRVYEMATTFIDSRFPHQEAPIHARVRGLVRQYLGSNDCTSERIAAQFCIHPRTLQRRLRAEGTSFQDIKDEVRRDAALQYLRDGSMSLNNVSERLGYAEPSVLSRSCYRWFSTSPRKLRMTLKAGAMPSDEKMGNKAVGT